MNISFTTLGPLRVACATLPPAISLLLRSDGKCLKEMEKILSADSGGNRQTAYLH
uniref:Uncharacterized protein n=1 Tax=Arundo donax TaxID=35708 RepID=A0A0A9DFE4_ARUDO